MDPLVSVIMPFYNEEKYIEKSVQCILEQTYKNLEIILIDDASNDKSFNIIKDIEDNRIKIIRLEKRNSISDEIIRKDSYNIDIIKLLSKEIGILSNKDVSALTLYIKNNTNIDSDILKLLLKEIKISMDIVYYGDHYSMGGFNINSNVIKKLSEYNISIDIDLYSST